MTAVIAGCDDPNEDELFVTPTDLESEMSVVEVLENNEDEFSLWVEFLDYANYYNALKDASSESTNFCPTNDAVRQFLSDRGVSSISELDMDYAKEVVQSHIISGTTILETTIDNYAKDSTYITTQNLFGAYMYLSYGYTVTDVDDAERTNVIYNSDSIYINNQARLAKFTATSCANGIIYTMGDVILPLSENIVEKLELEDNYTIFASAIRSDSYADSIATLVTDTTIASDGSYAVRSYSYTCFAVPDEVYAENGISSLDELKTYLVNNSDGEETDGDEALTHYLQYHFLTREYTTEDLFNFQTDDETLIFDTELSGQAIITNNVGGAGIINQTISILRSDVEARNGRINKVDDIMPVYHPTPVTVKWDFLNSSDIISFVNAYGADKNLGDIFTSAMESSERKIDLSEDYRDGDYGELTSFTYEANDSKASYSNYRKVGYTKEKYASASDKTTSNYGTYMDNYLTLNLGYAGWISFTTPSIIAGTYSVTLYYCKDVTLNSFFSSGTMTKFELDDESNITYLYKGMEVLPLYETVSTTLWSNVTFDESATHTFTVTMMDINAKTNSVYHQMLDCVVFTPIN